MRNFVVAVAVLISVTVLLIANSIYIRGICDDISALLDEGRYYDARGEWESKRDYLSLFLRDIEIDAADLRLRELLRAYESGDEIGEKERLIELYNALGEIKDCEAPTAGGIF